MFSFRLKRTTIAPSHVWILFVQLSLICFLAGCTPKVPDRTEEAPPHQTRASYETGDILRTASQELVTRDDLLADLSKAEVIYLGEQHDNSESHEVQLKIIKALHRNAPRLSIGFELFRENHQNLLDQWRRGKITKQTFKSRFSTSGGDRQVFNYYEQILNYAQSNNIPLVALKPTRDAVDELRENVTDADTLSGSRPLKPQELFLKEAFEDHVPTGRGYHTYVKVQQFWERRMASNIHSHLADTNGPSRMVVLTGNFHVLYDFGIPNKLDQEGSYVQRSILTLPISNNLRDILAPPGSIDPDRIEPADYVWWISPDT